MDNMYETTVFEILKNIISLYLNKKIGLIKCYRLFTVILKEAEYNNIKEQKTLNILSLINKYFDSFMYGKEIEETLRENIKNINLKPD